MLLPTCNCHTYFDIMSITEGVVFDRELRQKLRKNLNNRSPFKLHTLSTMPYLIVKGWET